MRVHFSSRDLEDMFVMKINFNMYFLKEQVLNLKRIAKRKLQVQKLETYITKLN